MFAIVEDSFIVLVLAGVYRQSEVYVRHGFLYAKHGSGFVKLSKHEKGTSIPKMTYEDLTLPFDPVSDGLGRLKKPGL